MFLHLLIERKSLTKKAIAVAPLLAIACFAGIKFALPRFLPGNARSVDLYRWLVREDGIVENIEFVGWVISVVFALFLSRQLFKEDRRIYGLLYLILCLGLFYVAMEEISWGQRIIHFKTTDYFLRHNYQKEMNTHNLRGTWYFIHNAYILIGLYGALVRYFLPRNIRGRYLFAPDSYLTFYFLPVAVLYFYYDYGAPLEMLLFGDYRIFGRFVHYYDQEVGELLLAFGFLFFLAINRYRLATNRYRRNAADPLPQAAGEEDYPLGAV